MRASRIIARILRLPTMFGGTFLLIGTAIVANALLLQPGRHPAPLFASPERAGQEAPIPDELVRDLQSALSEAGYYSGPPDGLAGPQTEAAIRAFEAAAGLRGTGKATPEILAAVRTAEKAGSPAQVAPAVARETQQARPDPLVAAVQNALARAAYGRLTPDGVFGPETRDAIVRFQRDRGLNVTGEISDALVVELRAAGALEGE